VELDLHQILDRFRLVCLDASRLSLARYHRAMHTARLPLVDKKLSRRLSGDARSAGAPGKLYDRTLGVPSMPGKIGVQVYTYREFTLEAVCAELADTDVTGVELMDTHLGPGADEATVETALVRLDDAGLDVHGYYAGEFDADSLADAHERFAFAAELGADYVACDFPAEAGLVDDVARLAADHDLLIGVHNHGPDARYRTVEDVLAVVDGAPDRVGACLDTGHFLRVDQPPARVIPESNGRIHAVHVSDYVDADTEAVPGERNLDIPEPVDLLERHAAETPLNVEYASGFDDPTPTVAKTARRLATEMA
jgi:sugar phosphate isomerase/epimerase